MLPSLPLTLTPDTAPEWLIHQGLVRANEELEIDELSGGVSGTVLRVSTHQRSIVLKQPMLHLKVRDNWEIGLDRIFIERDFMLLMHRLGLGDHVPALLACDESAYILAMSCIDEDAIVWKEALLRGDAPPEVAARAGWLLAELQNRTHNATETLEQFAHPRVLQQGRIAPYYIAAGEANPDLKVKLEAALQALQAHPSVVVHGDYSPKNMLFDAAGGFWLLDHEIAHAGHPAFDPAFCLTHLCLKLICFPDHFEATWQLAQSFLEIYRNQLDFYSAELEHEIARQLGWLLLARVDGKSKIEYANEAQQKQIRTLARTVIIRDTFSPQSILAEIKSRHQQTTELLALRATA